jgi:hypothetical protein
MSPLPVPPHANSVPATATATAIEKSESPHLLAPGPSRCARLVRRPMLFGNVILCACPLARVPPARGDSPAAPARQILVPSRVRRCGTRTPVSADGRAGPAGDQRLVSPPAIEPVPPGSQAGRARLACHRPYRARSRDGHLPGRCAGSVPAYLAGALAGGHPGEAGCPEKIRSSAPGGNRPRGQPGLQRLRSSRRSSHPGPRQPGISPGCQARFTGTGAGRACHSPYTWRVAAVDLSWT